MKCVPMLPGRAFVGLVLVVGLDACSRVEHAAVASEPPSLGGAALSDPHQGGRASRLEVVEVGFGRLVDLYDHDAASGGESLQYADLVVDPGLAEGADLRLEADAGRTRLVVLHPVGSPGFLAALGRATGRLPAVPEPSALPGAGVPRDAVLAVRFNDLVDSQSIRPETVWVDADGAPLGVRVLADPHHGGLADLDGDGAAEFHPTRVIIDPAPSALAALRAGGGQATGAGWPGEAEIELFLAAAGPGPVVEGARGARLAAATRDVSLAFESGPSFLAASGRPRVLGEQRVDVLRIQPVGGQTFVASYQFEVAACRALPARGDLLEFPGAVAEVLGSHAQVDPETGLISGVQLYLLAGSAAGLVPGPALYVAPFDAASEVPECFVTFSIPPLVPPAAGISSHTGIEVRFSRPMDPASVEALQSFALERDWPVPPLEEKVAGSIQATPDGTRFALVPSLPLATDAPTSPAAYVFDLDGSPAGVVAADGTPLAQDLPPVRFELDPGQPAQKNSGIVLEFDTTDEDGNGWPELRGQFLADLTQERILPRPVTRFSASVDASNPVVAFMYPLAIAMDTPLSPFGSKLMSAWRYCDFGFLLLDEAYHNIDVEGLYWSPADATPPVPDHFEQFQMGLSHAGYLPDEGLDVSLLPLHPASGLVATFEQNHLDPAGAAVVHRKSAGYTIDPLDQTTSAAGLPLMPWPMNRGIPASQFSYWTYRDTAVQTTGAPNGDGADPWKVVQVLGAAGALLGFYPEDQVPTIGLPLLSEFRTYPDRRAQGANGLRIAIAINSSANPFFRAFSTGGSTSGGAVLVDPDQEPVARGNLAGGLLADPLDDTFYYGQADFVVRVSRAHSVWFDTGGATSFGPAVLEPNAAYQPGGTSAVLAFRGATSISSGVPGIWGTTKWIGPYGDSYTASQISKLSPGAPNESFSVTYLGGDPTWKSALTDLDGARFVQARISFLANAETSAIPAVSGIGLPFTK
jgi:hypothetical protein